MKLALSKTNQSVLAVVLTLVAAFAFWTASLSPKRQEAKALSREIDQAKSSLASHQAEVAQGLEARAQFPDEYEQLVVLGKAVPAGDETPSLLVQLNGIAKRSGVEFGSFTLSSEGGGESAAPAATTTSGTEPAPATEVEASLLPLGASIGPAGLGVMPYDLTFNGNFFHLADFLKGLDSMVKTNNSNLAVTGRLITINGFDLAAGPGGFPNLAADIQVTTYLTPPEQGLTAGATPSGPTAGTATPASTMTGGAP
jgi:Tfp pilus assembly protein PilO